MNNKKMKNIDNLINKTHCRDCIELLKEIPDKSIDMILQDPPYNCTASKWEVDIFNRIDEYWTQWKRIAKKTAPIVFSARQPFTSRLIMSNLKNFKYEWIWDKKIGIGFQLAKYRPMQQHENIIVFGNGGKTSYYPIKTPIDKIVVKDGKRKKYDVSPLKYDTGKQRIYKDKYPKSIIIFSNANHFNRYHSNEKPLDLFKYLIQTYTIPGDIIFDGFAGSFTTSIAAEELGRNWICCDNLQEYCDIGQKRINELRSKNNGV